MLRDDLLGRLRAAEMFDVLVIGGGASGLGAAVDAAARGHRVALVEQADFAKGTSGRSTKLVHGGVRYLRQGDLALVRTALAERHRLAANAPHLVHDRAFLIPAYHWSDKPFYGLGLRLYDRLAGRAQGQPSHPVSRAEALRAVPTLAPAGLRGGVIYHDGQFDDARLAINLAQTAVGLGGVVVNYCGCVGLLKEGGRIAGALLRDGLGGAEFEVRARVVINATGIFVDRLREQDDPAAAKLVTVSQGIHLVLPRSFLPGETALMIPKTSDGRVLFAIPWHDRVVVGTTDTANAHPDLEPRAFPEEREYVLRYARQFLAHGPSASDVLAVFAGLRPLVAKSGARSTASLSRDHTLMASPSGLVTLTGGKWTTYRKMGEEAVDLAESVGGLPRRPAATAALAIHGATQGSEAIEHLRVYGTDAPEIKALAAAAPAHAALSRSSPAVPSGGSPVARPPRDGDDDGGRAGAPHPCPPPRCACLAGGSPRGGPRAGHGIGPGRGLGCSASARLQWLGPRVCFRPAREQRSAARPPVGTEAAIPVDRLEVA